MQEQTTHLVLHLKIMDFHFGGKCWKRRVPKNDEDLFKQILEILDMGPISTRKHEWNFGNIVPISTRKMTWNSGNLG